MSHHFRQRNFRQRSCAHLRDALTAAVHPIIFPVELKNILARQPGPEVAEQLSIYQQGLRDKTKSMKAMASELNMYQAQVCSSQLERLKMFDHRCAMLPRCLNVLIFDFHFFLSRSRRASMRWRNSRGIYRSSNASITSKGGAIHY